MQPENDKLWELAKKRAAFRKHLMTYIIVISFFWGIWFVTGMRHEHSNRFPWPAWIMLWWGIGLAFSYSKAYVVNSDTAVEDEYNKLKNQQ